MGLTIVILAVQFYEDVSPVFNDEESFISKDYLVITKNVTGTGAMLGNTGEFSEDDIKDIESQEWCRQVGRFSSSDFAVFATMGLGAGDRAMRTQFFFESIPSDFIDVDAAQWDFNPSRPEIPVIVSRDYVSLYNFGFATSQGLPQISESQMQKIPLQFTLTGNGLTESMQGRIVGFSNRLNTVIVPEKFMQWANGRYGSSARPQPLRLILEVNSPGDVKIEQYLTDHHYDVAGDKMSSSKANYFLTLIIGIVVVVGIIISLLSFFVLILSIYLLLQKNTRKLQDLLLLGYSPREVSRPYIGMVIAINAAVLVASFVVMLLGRSQYLDMLQVFGTGGASLWISLATGVVIMGLITTGNVIAIKRKIASLWRN